MGFRNCQHESKTFFTATEAPTPQPTPFPTPLPPTPQPTPQPSPFPTPLPATPQPSPAPTPLAARMSMSSSVAVTQTALSFAFNFSMVPSVENDTITSSNRPVSTTSNNVSVPLSIIIGGASAAAVIFVLCLAVAMMLVKKKRRSKAPATEHNSQQASPQYGSVAPLRQSAAQYELGDIPSSSSSPQTTEHQEERYSSFSELHQADPYNFGDMEV